MLSEPMLDPTGALILELRADTDVAALIVDRVRGEEPAAGDAQPKGSYKAYIVLATLGLPPDPFLPVTSATYGITCYGATAKDAMAVYAAVVKALHKKGPRTNGKGLGIYISSIVSGGEADKDPDTQQPCVRGTISLIATTQAVTE
jgi:hypothetical protein